MLKCIIYEHNMETDNCTPGVSRIIAGAALTAALELAGHWAPWPRRLPRLLAYVYGLLAILAGAAVILDRRTWQRVFGISAAAGMATLAGYVIDKLLNAWARRLAGHYERNN